MLLTAPTHPLARLDEAEQRLLDRVEHLVAERIGPDAKRVAREDVFAWDTFRLLAREGVIASAFPRQHGGTAASLLARVRIIEALASACSTAASIITGTDLSSRPLVAGASPALQAAWLPRLATGERQSAFALTEPGAGSDVARLAFRYTEAPDGSLRLQGRKTFITRAGTADLFIVVARRAGGPAGAKGLAAFAVPRTAPGITVSDSLPKLGWYGVPIAQVDFDDVPVAADHRLGDEGRGTAIAQDTLLRARIGHAADRRRRAPDARHGRALAGLRRRVCDRRSAVGLRALVGTRGTT